MIEYRNYADTSMVYNVLLKISRQLDDIAARLPMSASKNPLGDGLEKFYDQSTGKRPGKVVDENYKYSFSPKDIGQHK